MTQIKLFQFENCPFCKKVRDKLNELDLEYETVEVPTDRNHPVRLELEKKSGVATVPVIEVDGTFVGDSQKIIEYLDERF